MLDILSKLVTVIYYILVGYISAILLYSLIKSKKWEKELLYIVVLVPFLLRLFRLK
jgi:ABC-type spermidine/putrescine transport system permease subunit I